MRKYVEYNLQKIKFENTISILESTMVKAMSQIPQVKKAETLQTIKKKNQKQNIKVLNVVVMATHLEINYIINK